MNLNLTNLKDLEYICQIALDYFDRRMGTTEEIEWLQRIAKYRQLFQAEIYRLEAHELGLKQDAEIKRLRELIGELADALNCFKSMLHPPHLDLLQRAKEILL